LLAVRLRESPSPSVALALGLAGGFAFASRPQVAPIALVVAFVVPRDRWPAMLRLAPWGALGWLVGAAPQLVGSAVVYGSPLGSMRSVAPGAPWAAFERFWGWELYLSWYHGLLTWTPWALACLVGLVA